jgi:hypothetical protein
MRALELEHEGYSLTLKSQNAWTGTDGLLSRDIASKQHSSQHKPTWQRDRFPNPAKLLAMAAG